MKKNITILMLVLGVLSVSSFTVIASAPAPPDGVSEIIEQMGELEESFENQNWAETQDTIEKIDKELSEIFTQSKLNDTTLSHLLEDLKKAIDIKEEKLTETNFILFQKQYFSFLNNFNYEIHPLLSIIKHYIVDEASEALSKKDYDGVVSEMRETATLINLAKPLLVEKGISETEVTSLQSQFIEIIKAGRTSDADRLSVLLKEVEKNYSSMIERYKAAST